MTFVSLTYLAVKMIYKFTHLFFACFYNAVMLSVCLLQPFANVLSTHTYVRTCSCC